MVIRFRSHEALVSELSSRALFLAVLGFGITSTGVAHAQTVRQIINGPSGSNILADAVGRAGRAFPPVSANPVERQIQLSPGAPSTGGPSSALVWPTGGPTTFTLNYNAPTNMLTFTSTFTGALPTPTQLPFTFSSTTLNNNTLITIVARGVTDPNNPLPVNLTNLRFFGPSYPNIAPGTAPPG